jgi:hypothetical protein
VEGHFAAHLPHALQRARSIAIPDPLSMSAPCGQASTHIPHRMQREPIHWISGLSEMLSGLWHHTHERDSLS